MQKPFAIVVILTGLAASAAQAAAPVGVSAGEHQDFSRVVISNAGAVTVDQSERRVDIRIDAADRVDLSDINDKRKARRVVAARVMDTAGGTIIRLSLNCACVVNTDRGAEGKLIVDIRDAASAIAKAGPVTLTPHDEDSLEEARRRMIDLLRRAADEGLVSVRDDAADLSPPARRAEAAANSDSLQEGAATAQAAPAQPCLDDERFAIKGAPFEHEPLVAIAQAQAALGAIGDPSADDIARLVDGYLSIGFGDEALAILSSYGEAQSLRSDLARLIAGRELSPTGPLLGATGCRGAHALWQAAAGIDPGAARAAIAEAGDSIESLPSRLKAIIATRIAKTMTLAGAWSDAQKYYAIASQAAPAPTDDLKFVAAKLLEHEGRAEEAQAMLLDLSAGDSEASSDALLALAARYADGAEPHQGFLEDIGALAKMSEGSRVGADAAYREAIAWAKAGNIEASLLILKNATGSGLGAASAKAREILGAALKSKGAAKRVAALSAYLNNKNFVDDGADAAFERDVARAASDLGLPNVALAVAQNAGARLDRETALVAARAALDAGEGEKALALAAPYADDPSFGEIVIGANLQLERNHAALAAAAGMKDSGEKATLAARAAWRAGEWKSAASAFRNVDPQRMTEEIALQYALAAYMDGETTLPPSAEAVLKREKSPSYEGAKALFAPAPSASILDRGKALVDGASEEIKLVEEILGHG